MTNEQIHNQIDQLIIVKKNLINLNVNSCDVCKINQIKIIEDIDLALIQMKLESNYGEKNND